MRVTVELLSGRAVLDGYEINDPDAQVLHVKRIIEQQEGTAVSKLQLVHQFQVVEDWRKLADFENGEMWSFN